MRKDNKSFIIFILFVLAIFTVIAVTVYAAAFQSEDLKIKVDDVSNYQTGWFYSDKTGMRPVSVDSPELKRTRGPIVISNILPEALESGTVLGIKTNHQFLRVTVDGQLIYEYGDQNDIPFGSVFGRVWNLIEIPADKAGSLITLEIVSVGDINTADLESVFLGNRNAAAIYLFQDNLGTVLFCLFIFVLGLIFFALYCLLSFRKLKYGYSSFAYMSLFLLLSGMWILTDSFLPQFFFHNMTWVYVLSFLTFYLLPLPILLYVKEICPYGRKPVGILCFVGLGIFFVSTVLYFANLVEFYYSVYAAHLYMLCVGSVILAVVTREKRKYHNEDVSGLILGFYILCSVLLLGIILFLTGKEKLYSTVFQLGMVAFILVLCYSIVKKYISLLHLERESVVYKNLAYTDSLTRLGNRNAFEVKMRELDASVATIVVLDLNHLKVCNDTYGHSAGDDLIRGAAICIRSAFSGLGDCFRIGGDEFAVIVPNFSTEDLKGCFSLLEIHLAEYNEHHPQKISLAYGSASKTEESTDMTALFKAADKNMYDQKIRMLKRIKEEDV